jgi:eukaryotic-like serine/threonine-protein kinase
MTLSTGTTLGVYQIVAPLGEGGMGEVYRARDPRLDRDVALKVLRQTIAADADQQARLLYEARAASALSHPNIVTVHDVGTASGVTYIVMELVEGRPLDQLIPRHGMQAAEVLRIGAQIADAFAAAHAAGLIHRDLKPANVVVQPSGRLKVLDFGLAKLARPENTGATDVTVNETAEGMIVGTTAYMSPEQAEGRPLDGRSDIFSFGALLYELCSGSRVFGGESQASVLANVLRQEPRPLHDLRPDLPAELTRLVMRCLRKDPGRRVQSMADLRVAFDELREDLDSGRLSSAVSAAAPRRRSISRTALAAVAALVLGALAAGVYLSRGLQSVGAPADAPLAPVPLTSYGGRETWPTFSPDGNQVAFAWTGEAGSQDSLNFDIYVRLIGAGTPLRLSTDPQEDFAPQWSPDGRFIAFMRRVGRTAVTVFTVPALGGSERRLAQLQTRLIFDSPITSLAWTRDAKHLFLTGATDDGPNSIMRLSLDTGELKPLVPHTGPGEGYAWVTLSPDGRTLAAVRVAPDPRQVQLFDVSAAHELGPGRTLTTLEGDISSMTWSADSRELIFRRAANVPLPLSRVRADGSAPPVAMPWTGADAVTPAVSGNGRLAFARNYRDTNIWRLRLADARDAASLQQLASSSFREVHPEYSPDGRRIAFHSNRGGSIQVWIADGDGSRATQLTTMDPFATTGSPRWSPDGQQIIFDSNAGGVYQVYAISPDGGAPHPLTSGTANSFGASYSRDGRQIYFSSDRTGRLEVWRMPASGGEPTQVTSAGGSNPLLSPDGSWMYFIKENGTGGLWRLPVSGGDETRVLSQVFRWNYALTPEGIYFMTRAASAAPANSAIHYLDGRTGAIREVLLVEKPADLGLTISPDGQYLLFTTLDYVGTDLMLVENFR